MDRRLSVFLIYIYPSLIKYWMLSHDTLQKFQGKKEIVTEYSSLTQSLIYLLKNVICLPSRLNDLLLRERKYCLSISIS